MRFAAVASLTLLCAGVFACSPSSSDPADAGSSSDQASGDDGALIGCQNDSRADAYAANLTKTGKSGLFQFVLMSAKPAPPALNDNSWVLRVLDAKGNPLPNPSIVSVTPYMPDHGHGTSAVPVATSNGDGSFTISPLYLYMAGLWQITIVAQSGSQKDSAVFSFCIAG
jgi:hypothetical protein